MVALATIAALAGGWGAACLLLRRPPGRLDRPPHRRPNYRGKEVLGTLGVVLLAPLAAGGVLALLWAWGGWGSVREAVAVALAGAAMGALGLLDDLRGDRSGGGFAGHVGALRRGRVTTGLLKAGGGVVVGLAAAWLGGLTGWWIVAGGAVVALGANLANLLDLRPGRAIKGWLAGWVVLLAAGTTTASLLVTSGLAGGLAAFLPFDLRERGMLGDTGANLAGATLAAAAAVSVRGTALLVLLAVLAALTAASELVSFNSVIERTPPLRAVDRWGRTPP